MKDFEKLRKVELLKLKDLTRHKPPAKIIINDVKIVRDLAKRIKEISQQPQNIENIRLWKEHNSLKKTRPLILCLPEDSYGEIIPYSSLKCVDPFLREYEWYLKSLIYHWEELKDDYVITSRLKVPAVVDFTDWGLKEIAEYPPGRIDGAARYKRQLIKEQDLEKLRFPELIYDKARTEENLEFVSGIFDGILDTKLYLTIIPMFLRPKMMMILARLRGLDQILIDMIDRPEWVHKAMRFFTDGILVLMKEAESRELLGPNNSDDGLIQGGFGYTDELPKKDFNGKVRFKDLWGVGDSQELSGVSPAMMDEFLIPYQAEVLEKYGLNYYGCCEDLSDKFSIVKKIKNLRRVTVGPWTDMEKAARELEDKYVYVWKPNPAVVMDTFDKDQVKKNLEIGIKTAEGCIIEIMLRTLQTTGGDPSRLKKWCRIAMELAY
jgi:hypothetical protein